MFKTTVSKGKISIMLIAFMVVFFGAEKCFAAVTAADSILGLRVNTTTTGKLSATGTGLLTYYILAPPLNGGVTGLPNSTGAYSYEPKPNYVGTDSFTFYVKDNTGATAVATVAITVSLENIAPTANPATFTVRLNKDNSYSSSFTNNLTGIDPEGAALTYSLDAKVTVNVSVNPNGSFTYNPGSMLIGGLPQDSFTFKVNDGTLDSKPAKVTINVISATTPPVVQDGTYIIKVGDMNILDLKTKVVYAEGDLGGTFTIVSPPSKGTLNLSDGLFMYQAGSTFAGEDTFTFKVTSPDWESAPATITLLAKMPPVAQNLTLLTQKNTELKGNVIATGDNLDYVRMSDPKGTLTFNSDGSYTYKPNTNFTGIDQFTFKANDGTKDSAIATVTIIVGGIPGDVNGDIAVNLADAIMVLRILAGITPADVISLAADLNGDNKIGLEELLYILQKVAGLR